MFSHQFVFVLFDAAIKITLLMIAASAVALLSRRASASFRHLIWTLGLGCALGLPLLSYTLPHWQVSTFPAPGQSRPAADKAPPLAQATPSVTKAPPSAPNAVAGVSAAKAAPTQSVVANAPTPLTAPSPSPDSVTNAHPVKDTAPPSSAAPRFPASFPWAVCVLTIWMAGATFLLIQLAFGVAGIRELSQKTNLIADGPLADAARKAASSIEVKGRVELRQAESGGEVTVPLTYGVWHPVVVLPAGADEWPTERLQAALLHEMAHIKRHDWALQMLGHLAAALYWFHPLIWVGLKAMRSESETACDDRVLAAGMPAQDYARHLLEVALSVRNIRRLRSGTVAMAQGPKVEGRLRAVLASGISRRPLTQRTVIGVFVACLLILAPLAALRLGAQVKGVQVKGDPVPAADHLQLQGNFTLRYAVTVTDLTTTEAQFRQYQQLRADYTALLKKDPYYQPVPGEYYAPFAYFQKRRPRTLQKIITLSSQGRQLLWRSEEGGETYALVYNGSNGTRSFGNGHVGTVFPGLYFGMMQDCPMPAVGLPYIPLLKDAEQIESSGGQETWQAAIIGIGEESADNQIRYNPGTVHVQQEAGGLKLLDTDAMDQKWQFLQHQKFQGLWIASQMRLTKYDTDAPLPSQRKYKTLQEFMNWFKTVRKPVSVCEYRLLSASTKPLDLSASGMRLVSAPARSSSSAQDQSLDSFDVQEALHLRYHLQSWAKSHKLSLQQMAQGLPSGRAAVATSLSALPFPLWQGDPRPNHYWDGDPRVGHKGQKPLFTAEHLLLPRNAQLHDFEVAHSRSSGASRTILWASGRITRNMAQGTKSPETQQEIVPAFFEADGTSNMAEDAPSVGKTSQSDSSDQVALNTAYGFRRYISPPFSDGTRVTFLYPSCDTSVHQGWVDQARGSWAASIDCIGLPAVHWAALRGQTPIPFNALGINGTPSPAVYHEFCSLVVGNPGLELFLKGTNSVRQDKRWVGAGTSFHSVSIIDKRTHLRFLLSHENSHVPALFQQTDRVIFESFQVLPSGASPTA